MFVFRLSFLLFFVSFRNDFSRRVARGDKRRAGSKETLFVEEKKRGVGKLVGRRRLIEKKNLGFFLLLFWVRGGGGAEMCRFCACLGGLVRGIPGAVEREG